ncbi:MFS transporter [Paraburkholderia humisilvae]|uniref:Putative MFS-type transporter n=1 Tax=Paraburkholderia humisilvae TaxID=627669 RepID=A0A6J5DV74_9BURK|nr:MFS transporter [Paraburkholderia humisilvae]CAB3758099.1 putative MFS-type transporter [Paraburkholderia humisilvae]
MRRETGLTLGARAMDHRWKVLGVGFAANASFAAAFSGIPATAVFLRGDYHLANAGLGLVLGMLGLGIALGELPWGMLTDRWGDRRVLLLGLATTGAALAAMAGLAVPRGADVPGVVALASGLLAVGLLGGSVNGSSGRAVMAWFAEGERGLAMSIRQTAVPAGGGLGALMLPGLASHGGFASVFGVLALLCAVTAVFAWRWLREPPWLSAPATGHGFPNCACVASCRAVSPLRDLGMWRVALGIGVLCVPQLAVVTFAAVFLHDFARANLVTISGTLATVQAGAAVARIWSGRWTDRRGNRRAYLRTCSLITALLFALVAIAVATMTGGGSQGAAHSLALAGMLAVAGLCASAWHGVAYTELATLAGTHRAGTALAMGNTCAFMTLFVTPLTIPLLLSAGSWAAVWAVASVCALVALPVFPRAHSPVRENAARA